MQVARGVRVTAAKLAQLVWTQQLIIDNNQKHHVHLFIAIL